MKFINKHKVYPTLLLFIPPIILMILKKTAFFYKIKNIVNKFATDDHKPEWHKVTEGRLKGREIFIESGKVWEVILNDSYDNFLFDYIAKENPKGKTIFDIGAHIGYSSLNFAELVGKDGKVFSFEPNTANIERFEKILTKNQDLKERIKVFNLAISNEEGEENFIFSDNIDSGTSSGSFIESAKTIWKKEIYEEKIGFKRTKVKKISLDKFNSLFNINEKADIIKMDIEGAEYLAIDGAKEYLKEHKPLILVEIHSIYNMYSVFKDLLELGYTIEIIKQEEDGRCYIAAKPKKQYVT